MHSSLLDKFLFFLQIKLCFFNLFVCFLPGKLVGAAHLFPKALALSLSGRLEAGKDESADPGKL